MKVGLEALQKTQMTHPEEMNIIIEAPKAIEINGQELDLQVEMKLLNLWGLWVPGDS